MLSCRERQTPGGITKVKWEKRWCLGLWRDLTHCKGAARTQAMCLIFSCAELVPPGYPLAEPFWSSELDIEVWNWIKIAMSVVFLLL